MLKLSMNLQNALPISVPVVTLFITYPNIKKLANTERIFVKLCVGESPGDRKSVV